MMIYAAETKKSREPTNIQNSREFMFSSFLITGIFFLSLQ